MRTALLHVIRFGIMGLAVSVFCTAFRPEWNRQFAATAGFTVGALVGCVLAWGRQRRRNRLSADAYSKTATRLNLGS